MPPWGNQKNLKLASSDFSQNLRKKDWQGKCRRPNGLSLMKSRLLVLPCCWVLDWTDVKRKVMVGPGCKQVNHKLAQLSKYQVGYSLVESPL